MVIKSYHIILAVKILGCFLLKWAGFGELLGWKSSTRSGNTALTVCIYTIFYSKIYLKYYIYNTQILFIKLKNNVNINKYGVLYIMLWFILFYLGTVAMYAVICTIHVTY